MEFIDLMREILSYLPPESASFVNMVNGIFPWIVLTISLLVCLFGYKIHHIWSGFVFFLIGFLLGAVLGTLLPNVDVRIILAISLGLGFLGILLTHKLIKIQIFLINFLLVYSVSPDLLSKIIPANYSLLVGLILSILVGLIAVKYKYIVTIITTAYAGATSAAPIILSLITQIPASSKTLLIIVMIVLGVSVQFYTKHLSSKKKHKKLNNEAQTIA